MKWPIAPASLMKYLQSYDRHQYINMKWLMLLCLSLASIPRIRCQRTEINCISIRTQNTTNLLQFPWESWWVFTSGNWTTILKYNKNTTKNRINEHGLWKNIELTKCKRLKLAKTEHGICAPWYFFIYKN